MGFLVFFFFLHEKNVRDLNIVENREGERKREIRGKTFYTSTEKWQS